MLTLLLAVLSWNPVAGATDYHLWFQAHHRTVYSCPTPETPDLECVVYEPGMVFEAVVLAGDCGARCASALTLPEIAPGDVLWFRLTADRGGCESETAAPPPQ